MKVILKGRWFVLTNWIAVIAILPLLVPVMVKTFGEAKLVAISKE